MQADLRYSPGSFIQKKRISNKRMKILKASARIKGASRCGVRSAPKAAGPISILLERFKILMLQ